MPRKIEYIGREVEITDYKDCHRYCNQKNVVEGIPVNPELRVDFDSTPNDEREVLEIQDWWNKPYITTCDWSDWDESWESYVERMSSYSWGSSEPPKLETQEEFIERKIEQKENWFKGWPSGIRYDVRCLNGGAWDRSLGLAMVETLEAAVEVAKRYRPTNYGFI